MNPWGATVPPPTEAEFFNAARPTTFLLVEGGSDERFWLARVDSRECQVRALGGRERCLAEIRLVRDEGGGGFVAVLDADFDRLGGTLPIEPNVVWTDLHDLESILIVSPALDKLLVEAASRRKCDQFEATERTTVREALFIRALPLARLRWLSREEELKLVFRKQQDDGTFRFLEYQAFCDRKSWQLDIPKLVKTVLDFSAQQKLKPAALISRMGRLPGTDAEQICVGHDLVGFLMVGLRSKLGTRNLTIDELEERLRLAFERADLEKTNVFADLREWERNNAPYRVFDAR